MVGWHCSPPTFSCIFFLFCMSPWLLRRRNKQGKKKKKKVSEISSVAIFNLCPSFQDWLHQKSFGNLQKFIPHPRGRFTRVDCHDGRGSLSHAVLQSWSRDRFLPLLEDPVRVDPRAIRQHDDLPGRPHLHRQLGAHPLPEQVDAGHNSDHRLPTHINSRNHNPCAWNNFPCILRLPRSLLLLVVWPNRHQVISFIFPLNPLQVDLVEADQPKRGRSCVLFDRNPRQIRRLVLETVLLVPLQSNGRVPSRGGDALPWCWICLDHSDHGQVTNKQKQNKKGNKTTKHIIFHLQPINIS